MNMAALPPQPLPGSPLQNMLQAAVQSVQWTYSLFWQLCPQQGILVWGDGYYNGAIKTRKTIQPMEVSAEEASLQRSQQLRELYDSLSAGETNQPARRPCASLSPEDLTESEWFYLMCVSFTFGPGVGLPGKAYARQKHVWLTGANEVDSKVFTRAILAKSARVQTVVCIPLMDGVVEFGTTDRVKEDSTFVQHAKTFFTGGHHIPRPKPALSEQSTSNPAASSDHPPPNFHSPQLPLIYTPSQVDPTQSSSHIPNADVDEEEEDDDDEDDDNASGSDSESETQRRATTGATEAVMVEPSELMQLEMSEDIRLGSPDDASNNLDSDFNMLAVSQAGIQLSRAEESIRRWPLKEYNTALQPQSSSGPPQLEELTQEDTHYSQTVSTILQYQPQTWSQSAAAGSHALYSTQSAFAKWTLQTDRHSHFPSEGTSQWLLKYILFSVPYLHTKYQEENSPKSRDNIDATNRFRKNTPQEELSANHVLAERRRREKLNERFIILRSLVPFVTKMDKASILGDTIEYVKQLRKKIQDLETKTRHMEVEQRCSTSSEKLRSGSEKRKMRIVEGSSGAKPTKAVVVESGVAQVGTTECGMQVQVSIIESDALVELQCPYSEGLLLDIMLTLRGMRVEVTAVQSSLNNNVAFVAELRAKVKENENGKKATIAEVKRAIHQIIPQ